MREQDEVAILDAMAELGHLENRTSRDEAMRVAIAQMCAGGRYSSRPTPARREPTRSCLRSGGLRRHPIPSPSASSADRRIADDTLPRRERCSVAAAAGRQVRARGRVSVQRVRGRARPRV